jgi:hypothetical protein
MALAAEHSRLINGITVDVEEYGKAKEKVKWFGYIEGRANECYSKIFKQFSFSKI